MTLKELCASMHLTVRESCKAFTVIVNLTKIAKQYCYYEPLTNKPRLAWFVGGQTSRQWMVVWYCKVVSYLYFSGVSKGVLADSPATLGSPPIVNQSS